MIYDSMGHLINTEELWEKKLEEVKIYMDVNDKRPSSKDKIKKRKSLGVWIVIQLKSYIKRDRIMKNEEIYNKWTKFINDDKYKKYFISNEEIWLINLEKVKKYIDENDKRPSSTDKNKDIKQLGSWISNQMNKYKTKKGILSNIKIYNKWKEFINDKKYKKYFILNKEIWLIKLEEVKKYIDENNKKLSLIDKDKNIKQLCNWINDQQKNFKMKIKSMKNKERYDKWEEFINNEKYKKYFISNEDEWFKNFEEVKKYIDENNERPTSCNKNKSIEKLGKWIQVQQQNYKKKIKL